VAVDGSPSSDWVMPGCTLGSASNQLSSGFPASSHASGSLAGSRPMNRAERATADRSSAAEMCAGVVFALLRNAVRAPTPGHLNQRGGSAPVARHASAAVREPHAACAAGEAGGSECAGSAGPALNSGQRSALCRRSDRADSGRSGFPTEKPFPSKIRRNSARSPLTIARRRSLAVPLWVRAMGDAKRVHCTGRVGGFCKGKLAK